jgi:starch phosphorylase
MDHALEAVLASLEKGTFASTKILAPLLDTLTTGGDYYLISADFRSYLEAQDRVDVMYKDAKRWAKASIMCTAGMGKFSSDRSIQEYAQQIWKVEPCAMP